MATTYTKKAPPASERPRCLYCGKRLKPHYTSSPVMVQLTIEQSVVDKVRQVEALTEKPANTPYWNNDWRLDLYPRVKVFKDDSNWSQICVRPDQLKTREDGTHYIETHRGDVTKEWTGHYSFSDLFCGGAEAAKWAVCVHKKLIAEGKSTYICYDANKVK